MKTSIGWLLVGGLFVSLILYFIPWPQKIEVELQGIHCRMGEVECGSGTVVSIQGTFKNYLIKKDQFEGNISVSGYDFAHGYVEFQMADGVGYINYLGAKNDAANIESLGRIVFSSGFKDVLILVSEPVESDSNGWRSESGLYIAANAKDHDSALALAKKLSQNSQWLSTVEWK